MMNKVALNSKIGHIHWRVPRDIKVLLMELKVVQTTASLFTQVLR